MIRTHRVIQLLMASRQAVGLTITATLLAACTGTEEPASSSSMDSRSSSIEASSTPSSSSQALTSSTSTSSNTPAPVESSSAANESSLPVSSSLASSMSSIAPPPSSESASSEPDAGLNAQQQRGYDFYLAQCAGCHGAEGDGGVPGQSSILNSLLEGTLVNKTSASMPLQNPALCNLNCAKDVEAWLSYIHGVSSSSASSSSSAPSESYSIQRFNSREVYRRASVLLGKGIPSVAELDAAQGLKYADLRTKLLELMTGNGFKEFIKTGANDRLLTRGIASNDYRFYYLNFYPNFQTLADEGSNRFEFENPLRAEHSEEPLELIYHVIKNDLPYTEILTADYTMVSHRMSRLYGYNNVVNEGQWRKGKNTGQHVSIGNGFPSKDWDNSRQLEFPHVGLLSSVAYLNKYPSTATNRNRARSRWTMYHFLGYDIEASVPRVKIDDAADADNPTLNNPACTSCHITMDPIAAGFQDFSDKGLYRIGNKALDSLSRDYKKTDLYEVGQTWYADVLPAGFNGEQKPEGEQPLRWLAEQITQDPRFGSAVVKFWWPAIFGEELYATNSEVELLKQQEFVTTIARKFKQRNWDFKQLLADILMSDWYRARNLSTVMDNSIEPPLTYTGYRLLTPEEMAIKQTSLLGTPGQYLKAHQGAFGGIDSVSIVSRDRNINVVKMNVAKANAYKDSCSIVYEEFSKTKNNRTLFSKIELADSSELKIREQLVHLYERLLGERYNTDSGAINQAYTLFNTLKSNAEARNNKNLVGSNYACAGQSQDRNFDTHFTFAAWKGVLAALTTDFRFISE